MPCFGVDISLQCNSCFQQDSEKRREKRNSEMMDSELKMANEVFMKVSKEVSLSTAYIQLSVLVVNLFSASVWSNYI